MRVWLLLGFLLIGILTAPLVLAGNNYQTNPEVYIEAIGTANLRSGPSTDFAIIGEIKVGTEYRVLARHELYPWYLIDMPSLPTQKGWVFNELVTIKRGDVNLLPIESSTGELPVIGTAVPLTPTPATVPQVTSTATAPVTATATAFAPPPTLANLVTVRLIGRTNIRYGPSVDTPIMLTLDAGAVMTVTARHSYYPWLKVAVEGAPNGEGWIYVSPDDASINVEITGDIYSLPVITDLNITFPTPSATPHTVADNGAPWPMFQNIDSNPLITGLGLPIDRYLLAQQIAPRTDREMSVFVLDLKSRQHFVLNGGVAYSGMSINKISILLSFFVFRDTPIFDKEAELIASTMICSDNAWTNRLLAEVGDGDLMQGATRVTETLRELGLGNTFLVAPYKVDPPGATATPAPASMPTTNVDQQRTQPDPFNQITVEEVGWLLGGIYQCAADGSGPLVDTFVEKITQLECGQMLRVMRGNHIGALIEAGLQPGTPLAHKHGWVNDTHGDAGIVFSPNGAYVLAMVYHERTSFLESTKSFPIMEQVSMMVWNYFNSNAQLQTPFSNIVPETCDIHAEPIIPDMLSGNVALPR